MASLRLSLLLALAVALAGCGSSPIAGVDTICEPGIEKRPCARGVEQGSEYRFRLQTHCGIEWAYFDGRYWLPREHVDTPPYWDGITDGRMTLVSRDFALFKNGPTEVPFVPAPESYRPPPCA